MNKNHLLTCYAMAFMLLSIIISCKKGPKIENPVPSSTSVTSTNDKNFVSLSIASIAAKQANNSHLINSIVSQKIIQSTVNSASKQILDSIAVPNNLNPSYYIFNYVGGGFIVIPADKRVEPILAYSNSGYFPHAGALPSGLVNWLTVNHKNMQLLRKDTSLKTPPGLDNLWAELTTASSNTSGNKVTDQMIPPPPPCEPTYSAVTVGPLLQTAWAQGYPYNLLCPTGNYTDAYTPTGCVATAMAQIMYYWKAPASYNWSIMPLASIYPGNNAGNMAVAQLMVDIGTSVSMLYHNSGSYPSLSNVFPPRVGAISCSSALKNTFGYGSATDASYNYLNVMSNLNAGEPVLLGATIDNTTILFWSFGEDGHEWVCDGYQEVNTTWCPSGGSPGGGESFLYMDMNWGWNEAGATSNVDGWYDFNQWLVYNGPTLENYQYNQTMSYNIHP